MELSPVCDLCSGSGNVEGAIENLGGQWKVPCPTQTNGVAPKASHSPL